MAAPKLLQKFLCFNQISKIHNVNSILHCSKNGLRTTACCLIKKIQEYEKDGVSVIEAVHVESPHKDSLVKPPPNTTGCPLCRLGITNIKHTDVLLISQFMDSEGNMLQRDVTGLCNKQHKIVSLRLYEAQRCGLIKRGPNAIPKARWQELNNYFGYTPLKIDYGKPKIDIKEFLKKPPSATKQ